MIFFEDTPFPGYKRDPFLEVPYIYVFFFNVFSFFSVFWLKLLEEWCCGLFSFFFFAEILSIISLIWSPPQPVVPKPIWTHLALWGLQPILFKTYPDPHWPNLALWGLQPILFKTYPDPNWPNLALWGLQPILFKTYPSLNWLGSFSKDFFFFFFLCGGVL